MRKKDFEDFRGSLMTYKKPPCRGLKKAKNTIWIDWTGTAGMGQHSVQSSWHLDHENPTGIQCAENSMCLAWPVAEPPGLFHLISTLAKLSTYTRNTLA